MFAHRIIFDGFLKTLCSARASCRSPTNESCPGLRFCEPGFLLLVLSIIGGLFKTQRDPQE